jgi:hypothetical protein
MAAASGRKVIQIQPRTSLVRLETVAGHVRKWYDTYEVQCKFISPLFGFFLGCISEKNSMHFYNEIVGPRNTPSRLNRAVIAT